MVRLLGSGLMLMALSASANAQSVAPASVPGGSTATMTPMERARRDADKVFYWVKLHGNAPAKPAAAATPTRETAANTVSRPAAAPSPAPAAAAAAAVKRPAPIVRTAEAPSATVKDNEPVARAAPEAGDEAKATAAHDTPDTPAPPAVEPPAPAGGQVEPPTESKEPAPPAAAAPVAAAAPEPAQSASAPSAATPPPSAATIVPADKLDARNEAPDRATRADEPGERLQPIAQPAPEFPSAVVQALRRGSVRVQFNVLPDGSVAGVDVLSSSNVRLNPAALAAVAQWRFQPVARAQPAQVDLAFSID